MEEYHEDDKDTITVAYSDENAGKSLPTPVIAGIELDLSFAAQEKSGRFEDSGIQEESVLVVFDLPDGSQGEYRFKLGHTVEYLKSYIESEYGIPMMDQQLFLDDKIMHGPFSLLDFPEAKGWRFIFLMNC